MKPTRNEKFLSLIKTAIATTIKPELSSDVARQTADIIMLCLDEMGRREQGTAAVLAAANQEGSAIADAMVQLLSRCGFNAEPSVQSDSAASHDVTPVDQQISEHERVTTRLASLADQLINAGADAEAMALMERAAKWEVKLHSELLPAAQSPETDAPYQPPSDDALRVAIEAFLRTRHPDGARVSVTEFKRVTGGFSKSSYLLTVRNASGNEEALVVRKMGRKPLIAFEACLIEDEFQLLSTVAKTDFPCPKPLWLGVDVPGVDSSFYVMTRLPGQTIGTFLGGADILPERYLLDLAEALAKLHGYPLETFSSYIDLYGDRAVLSDTVSQWYHRRISEWRNYAMVKDADQHLPSPMMNYLLAWLDANVPEDNRPPVLIHGDYNIHNMLSVDGRVSGVLDWENAMFGAPEHDLAYLRPNIEKHIDWNRFVQHYRDSGGREVRAEHFDFYLAFNAMRITFGSNRAVKNLQTGAMSDIRLAMIEFGFLPDFMRVSLQRAESYTQQKQH